jgi:putative DNA primase/helicase
MHKDDVKTTIEFIAYCLISEQKYHQALMLLGDGANGKSTFIELVRCFLSEENTTSISLQTLIENRFAAAGLYGKLANLYADIPADILRQTGMFKILTGGDTLTVEKKFLSPFQFKNTTKLIFSANVLPLTLDDSEAFFRRWILLDFPHKFEGANADPDILKKITTEDALSAFFNVCVDALHSLLKQGFSQMKSTEEKKREYIEMSNPILIFVQEKLECSPQSFEPKDKVYNDFCEFCINRKLPVKDKALFGRILPMYIRTHTSQHRIGNQRLYCWDGIVLKSQEEQVGQEEEEQAEQKKEKEKEEMESARTVFLKCEVEEGICERCGLKNWLDHEWHHAGKNYLICPKCADELK